MVSHSPVKSGLPSAVRGAGALTFTSPFAVRGTFGVLKIGHCAESAGANAVTTASTPLRLSPILISTRTSSPDHTLIRTCAARKSRV